MCHVKTLTPSRICCGQGNSLDTLIKATRFLGRRNCLCFALSKLSMTPSEDPQPPRRSSKFWLVRVTVLGIVIAIVCFAPAIGQGFMDRGDFPAAEPFLRIGVALHPNDADYQYGLGDCLEHLEKYTEAEPYVRRAAALEPNVAWRVEAIGIVLYSEGKYAGALSAFQRAANMDPQSAEILWNTGDTLIALKRYPEAETQLRAAVKIEPNTAIYENSLGYSLEGQGKYGEALFYYQIAAKLEPDNADYQANLKRCEQARAQQ